MTHTQCRNLHRFGCEYDHDEASFDLACSRLRRAAHRALAGFRRDSHRKEMRTTGVQCDLEPEQVTTVKEEREPEVVNQLTTGNLSISGNVLLASDWDLADDDVRFAYYPFLNLKCCGVHEQRNQRLKTLSNVERSNLRKVGQDRTQIQCQRIPRFREAFPQRPSQVNPEASEELQNRVRQTYDHAHSLPLHKSDKYVYLHTRRAKLLSREGPSRIERRVTIRQSHPRRPETLLQTEGRPLAVHCPVCVCPRVAPPPAVIPTERGFVNVPPLVVRAPESDVGIHECGGSSYVTPPLKALKVQGMEKHCCDDQNVKSKLETCWKCPKADDGRGLPYVGDIAPTEAFSLPLPPSTATNICF